ncbi:MAG: hypothetical protein J6Z23_06585 [Lachnospiraceae bacterium]|nr:hypothetical protein [Lachnospiraceae bacterium]
MNTKKIWLSLGAILLAAAVFTFVIAIVNANGTGRLSSSDLEQQEQHELPEQSLRETLLAEGLTPEEIRMDGGTLYISIRTSSDPAPGAGDILDLRTVRNAVRRAAASEEALLQGVHAVANRIVDAQGTVLYDATVFDFFNIPEGFQDSVRISGSVPGSSEEETADVLEDAFRDEGLPLRILEVSINPLGGYFVRMDVDGAGFTGEPDAVNRIVRETVDVLDGLNARGSAVGAFRFTVADPETQETVFLMDADLVYRDFLWWQDPAFGFGTWTGSTPRLQE